MGAARAATRWAMAAVVAFTAAGCGRSAADLDAGPGVARVVEVTDGDTIRVKVAGVEEPVRLIGIDTPETRGRGGLRECFGREATERTKALLPPDTAIRLVRDVEARDRYDRLLAYVYRDRDDLFVNMALAEEGYAAAATFPPNVAFAEQFVAAAASARERGLGLWSACGDADVAIP